MTERFQRDGFWHRLWRWVRHGEAPPGEVPGFAAASLGLAVVGAVGGVLLLAIVRWIWVGLVLDGPSDGTQLRDYVLSFAAVIGAPFVVWRTLIAERNVGVARRNAELSEQRNTTDAFTKAIELLGATKTERVEVTRADGTTATEERTAPNLEQRLGAIYALERIARENVETYHIQIMETLCAYVREHAPAKPGEVFPGSVLRELEEKNPEITDEEVLAHPAFQAALAPVPEERRDLFMPEHLRKERKRAGRDRCLSEWLKLCAPPREDIRAILDVLSRRTGTQRKAEFGKQNRAPFPEYRLDLRSTCLRHVSPAGTELTYARLDGAQMEGATLIKANLDRSTLRNARLEATSLIGANLVHASLNGAWLGDAVLGGAKMERTVLPGARMERADLTGSKLVGSDLRNARLQDSSFWRALLDRPDLRGAQLTGATFDYSYVDGRAESRYKMERTNFTLAQNEGGALRFVDFTEASVSADFFVATFGDATVILPEGFHPPPQWLPHKAKDDVEFFGHWRGWLEANREALPWGVMAPPGLENVTPLPPPNGATWPKD